MVYLGVARAFDLFPFTRVARLLAKARAEREESDRKVEERRAAIRNFNESR
jgi:hypothetical protein